MNRLYALRLCSRSSAVVLVAVVLALPAEVRAQAVRGTLLGTITDQAGLALPGAAVTVTEVNTNIGATTVANESGFYTFTLRDGVYRVEAELSGFKKTVREGIEVDVNTTVRVDLRLEVGVVEESITVVGANAAAADGPRRHRAHHRGHVDLRRCRSHSIATSRACSSRCPARRGRSARTRSSSTRRTASRPTSTGSRGSPTTCSSKASTTTTRPGC